jgi:hypothetical protein
MSAAQQQLYGGMMRLARQFGTGGNAWSYAVPASAGVTSDVSMVATGTRRLWVLQNGRSRNLPNLPDVALKTAPWWGIGQDSLAATSTLTASGFVFTVSGRPDDSQGFYVTPLIQQADDLTDTIVISNPGSTTADGFGGQTTSSPTTVTTVGALLPLGNAPDELAIASRAAGSHVVSLLIPRRTTISNQSTVLVNGITTIQVLGVVSYGLWEARRKVVGKVIT